MAARHSLLWSLSFGLVLFGGSLQGATADGTSHSYNVTNSKDGVIHHGLLTIGGSGVTYSEGQSDNFHASCGDFLKGMSLKKSQDFLELPVPWRDHRLRSDEQGVGTPKLFQLIGDACSNPGAPMMPINPDEISYSVLGGEKRFPAHLIVHGAQVHYSDDRGWAYSFGFSCQDFLRGTFIKAASLRVMGKSKYLVIVLYPLEKGPTSAAIYQGIREACAVQKIEVDRQATLLSEQEARREEAAAVKRKADFNVGILAALHAAEEADPFASIRGEFDLSASDSRQWKTSLQLEGAEKCALLRTPPANPTSPPVWTFGCMFRASGDGYEGMVKSVQAILNLPYEPDDKAVNINQVFFADRSKPARRVFVAKINEATIGVSVVAVQSAGAPVDFNSASFLAAPTVLPTQHTISEEIETVRNGKYTPLPPIQQFGAPATGNGMAVFQVKNNTDYTLTALFSGPIERRVEVAPRGSTSIDLQPGSYKLVGRVNAPNVLPSYGEHVFNASSAGVEFYIKSQ